MSNTTLVLTRGLPGSGKSTWAAEWVDEHSDWRARVNRDDLRFAMYGKYVIGRMREESVTIAQHAQVRALLLAGISVVVDDTNLRAQTVRGWQKIATETGAEIIYKDVTTDVEVCIARNAIRASEGGRDVPEEVIRSMAARYIQRGRFPEIPESRVDPESNWVKAESNENLPSAYIVDIDGTLADMSACGRGPFDWARVGEDTMVHDVIRVVLNLQSLGHTIIFMSGRDAVCRSETTQWLLDAGFTVNHLYMRPEGDMRKDSIVKHELFNRNVRDQFNVLGVFDDRNQVVKMWRAIGLTVFQVADGDF